MVVFNVWRFQIQDLPLPTLRYLLVPPSSSRGGMPQQVVDESATFLKWETPRPDGFRRHTAPDANAAGRPRPWTLAYWRRRRPSSSIDYTLSDDEAGGGVHRRRRAALLHEMETLLSLESQCVCTYGLFEEARAAHDTQHAALQARLHMYQQWMAAHATAPPDGHDDWALIQDMVDVQLPQVLAHLQVKIDANDAKGRQIRAQMDALRTKRHALQDEILQADTHDTTAGQHVSSSTA
ncbi:Aste57867_16090 [Aphanomyces stellatus]|uniref:Aste57867_16090 protein n=1 Tax=Aphanomyces stellatus TaxID=120398 RepID=A0A485L7U9_9STRA|nr:hypothetical protein As57867_016034 [Aphanomyces stellatus]VFT92873.1 Aste57867_16090 [Aphanomyces stellatus]